MQKAANDGLRRAFDDLDDLAFRPTTAVMAHDTHPEAVFVQHGTHFVGWQIDVSVAVIADEEAVAIAVALDCSLKLFQQAAGLAQIFDMQSLSFLE